MTLQSWSAEGCAESGVREKISKVVGAGLANPMDRLVNLTGGPNWRKRCYQIRHFADGPYTKGGLEQESGKSGGLTI